MCETDCSASLRSSDNERMHAQGAHDGWPHRTVRASIGFVWIIHKAKCEIDCSVSLGSSVNDCDGQLHPTVRPSVRPSALSGCSISPSVKPVAFVSLRSHSSSTSAEFLITLRHRSRSRRRKRRRRRRRSNYRASLKKEDRRKQNVTLSIYLSVCLSVYLSICRDPQHDVEIEAAHS